MIIADGLWGDAHNAADVTVIKTHLVEDNEEMRDDRYDSNVFEQSNLSSTFSDLSEDTIK